MPSLVSDKEVAQVERVSAHSHIRGLGLDAALNPVADGPGAEGLTGQGKARRAAGVIGRMARAGKIAGRGVLVTGPPGTGKTALALALSRTLGEDVPFVEVSSSEVFSLEMGKTEALTQALRRAMGVRLREVTELVEGEVVEVQVDRPAAGAAGAGAAARTGKVTMKTTDMETVYELGGKMAEAFVRQRVVPGDVVSIDKGTGKVTRLGRSFSRANEYEVSGPAVRFVACPEGELQRRAEATHTVSLHDMDVINSRQQGFLALFAGDTGEIGPEVRVAIDAKVAEWRAEGKADLVPGVLFLDEADVLDLECFSFLNRALEQDMCPVVVMATNRSGMCPVRGSPYAAPHGIPQDLLDRLLVIATRPYEGGDLARILRARADEEGAPLDETALGVLQKVAGDTSLRYAIRLIAAAASVAARAGSERVEAGHVATVYSMFLDQGRSAAYLESRKGGAPGDRMMFDE